MKEHKMKKSFLLSTLERYKAAGYPRESINYLQDLESSCERLGDLLEEFRHIQPGKRLFSPESIGVIKELRELREQIYRLENELDELRSRLPKSEEMITFLPTDNF